MWVNVIRTPTIKELYRQPKNINCQNSFLFKIAFYLLIQSLQRDSYIIQYTKKDQYFTVYQFIIHQDTNYCELKQCNGVIVLAQKTC